MPSSQISQISTIMEIVLATRPQSVLDVGVGFGKYGFLCREYLELWDGRDRYGDWQRRIDGIEAFEQYLTPVHEHIYDNIYVGDALSLLPGLDTHYDLILLIDVIEHFTLDDGRALLAECARKANACLVSTPLAASAQAEAFGNQYEVHRSQWTGRHFDDYANKVFIPNARSLVCYLRFDGARVQARTAPAAAPDAQR
ncbi:MAG TPA: class I SAM-dependent methyltransferase [Acidobacteriota bacterium]|nr:class I SAM-dependent methyltransferase [Acidobacteriota bacterium]